MTIQNPATPAPAATPGSHEQVPATPSAVTPPANPGQGTPPEGTVTIPTSEFAKLQRDSARVRSFDKRKQFNASRNNPQPTNGDPEDPANQALAEANQKAADAEKRAMQAEIRGQVRDLLDKDEFKVLPKSTRDLILKNPHMLSNADNAEEAMLDIEDFVRDQVAGLSVPAQPSNGQPGTPSSGDPAGHQTPPKVNGGVPSQPTNASLEDTSNLRGTALSRATLRNSIRKQKMGVK